MTHADDEVIAVIGATGQQGGATARALLAAGARVRGLTRHTDSDAARALADAGAELVAADLDDADSVRAAFDGAATVFAMTTMTGDDGVDGEVSQGRIVADAALAAGVGLLVYSSVGAAERNTGIPHFDSKWRVEQYLAGLDIESRVIRPVFFMENLLGAKLDGEEVVVSLPFPDDVPLQLIAVADIGTVAASVLLDPAAVDGAIEIGGDELTGSGMAAVFGAHTGRPARYQALPLDALGDDEDMKSMFSWFTGPDTYHADRDGTRRLDPGVMDLAGWLSFLDWQPS